MLNNLRIKNFRMLEDLHIAKLGRVNLIVGKNNCGKSTVLEALRLYAGRAHPNLLQAILFDHDESLRAIRGNGSVENNSEWWAIKHLFPNREFPKADGKPILIQTEGDELNTLIQLEHIFYYLRTEEDKGDDGEILQRRSRVVVSKTEEVDDPELTLRPAIRVNFGNISTRSAWLDIEDEMRRTSHSLAWRMVEDLPVIRHKYLPTHFLPPSELASLWDETTLSPNEAFVLQALRIIEPDVEGLAFVKSSERDRYARAREGYSRTADDRVAIIKLKNQEMPIPLNSMGDGMLRILQLILAMFPARGGLFLVDELENGLHYSVQEEVWKLIFKLATDLDIQVFVTTHSWDCIESFTKVAVEDTDTEGVLLKLARSRLTGKVVARVYDEADLQTITASELEIR